jgi:hypothetical protein
MQYILRHPADLPDWQAASARRLNISMLLATLIVLSLLSVIRLPVVNVLPELAEMMIYIVQHEERVERLPPVPKSQDETVPRSGADTDEWIPATEVTDDVAPSAEKPVVEAAIGPVESTIEWEDEKAAAVQAAIDALENTVSVNPNFDERRKEAAIRFHPSDAPEKKEIWDNVEKDQMGRTILRSGDCYRILDDPSVANLWAFENFDQYITYCTYRKYVGKELPWVDEIRERHKSLRDIEERRDGNFEWDEP